MEAQQNRFHILRIIAVLYRVVAAITGIIGLLNAIGAGFSIGTVTHNGIMGLLMFFVVCIASVVAVMSLLAASEGIQLFIDIADDARRANDLLGQLVRRS